MSRKVEDTILKTIDAMEPVMRSVVVGYYYNQQSASEIACAMQLETAMVFSLVKEGGGILRQAVLAEHEEEKLFSDNRYLYTQIFLSCGEEAVRVGEIITKERETGKRK